MNRALAPLVCSLLVGCVGELGESSRVDPEDDDGAADDGAGDEENAPYAPVAWDPPMRQTPPAWEPVETAWCAAEGWVGLDAQTCFYVPSRPAGGRVVVYLHGMMPPDASPAVQEDIVASAAEAAGAVAIFPKGTPGLCSWDPSVLDWLCWPTSRANVDAHAAQIIAGFDGAVALLEEVLSLTLDRRHVFGFSNGGYFASFIGLEELWHNVGTGLVGAGRSYVDQSVLPAYRPPMYIAVGALETTDVQNSAQNLAYVLGLEDWPHQLVVHAGRGHEVHADDLDAAFALWGE